MAPVADEVRDGDEGQVVLLGEGLELGQSGHARLVLGDHLAQHARGVLAGQAAQVDGGFGVPGALQDAAGTVAQGDDVARAVEIGGLSGRVDEGAHRGGAVAGGDARGRAVAVVDGDGEGRALGLGVGDHHQGQVQLVGAGGLEGDAEDPRGVLEEEGHGLRRDVLGRHDEVALVLAVLVVDDDDHAAAAQLLQGFFNAGQRHQTSRSIRTSSPTRRNAVKRARRRASMLGVDSVARAPREPADPAKAGAAYHTT